MNTLESNWTLTKVSILDNLILNTFLKPAITYEDFYMTQSLANIKCFKKLMRKENKCEYILQFNGTITKSMLVQQQKSICTKPQITTEDSPCLNKTPMVSESPNKDVMLKMHKKSRIKSKDNWSNTIKMISICKINNIIMNWVPEKKLAINKDKK